MVRYQEDDFKEKTESQSYYFCDEDESPKATRDNWDYPPGNEARRL
jgi:hypothetical protein